MLTRVNAYLHECLNAGMFHAYMLTCLHAYMLKGEHASLLPLLRTLTVTCLQTTSSSQAQAHNDLAKSLVADSSICRTEQ